MSILFNTRLFARYRNNLRPEGLPWKAFYLRPGRVTASGPFFAVWIPDFRASARIQGRHLQGTIQGITVRLDRMPIGLRYCAPSPSLRSMVSSYYLFHADLPHYVDLMRADLPQFRFMISGSAKYQFQDGRMKAVSRVNLIGPTYSAYRFEIKGPVLVFGIGLQPAGWSALVRDDSAALADGADDAEARFGPIIGETLEILSGLDRVEQMAAVADRLMGALMARVPEPPLWFTRITDHWLTSLPSPEVDTLISAIGMSGRQVERLAKRIYGASPKLLARKYRALKAASEFAKGDVPWSEVAGDAFSDQSHFIREFRQFIGLTPTQLVVDPPPVTRLTLEGRRLNHILPRLTKIT